MERDLICNGCGPKGGIVPVPEFIFTASCDHHDFNYWLGCTEGDRAKADHQFYTATLSDAAKTPYYIRWWYMILAWTYYRAVRRWGKSSFYYGPAQRTRADLESEIGDLI